MSEPFGLEGRTVHLLPLSLDHVDGLLVAATGDRSSFGYTLVPSDRAAMTDYVERAVARRASGEQVPFATWSVTLGRVVGSTRFYDVSRWDWTATVPGSAPQDRKRSADSICIGHTWLDPAAQRTPVNTEAKLLMLDHAFDVYGVRVVRLWTDARNARSRSAIARLGCCLDGVLRADRPASDGSVRDSAVFSMLAEEWPTARRHLVERLRDARPHRA
jgi:N-acetyltransferase